MSGLFGGGSNTQPPPTTSSTTVTAPTPAPVMPDTESPAVREAERARRAEIMRRGGRSRTILSDEVDGGGESNYSRRRLG